ncbi:unnamed protein product [Paramecium primaurelia]|uniref:Chorein N-terminal domain-containing protein n=1 Tax=Paramecium primaurelia TaxID=5886 RepID=A0A8S1PS58_PARPR|nr:unnamed protein product [Paramecium primaurelia]
MQFLKSYLTDYINTYVYEYFDNISKEQITTQLTKGQIQLNNMQFKPSIFKKLNLPFIIKDSMINNISITLGKQSSIKIDTLNIVIEILNLYGNFIMESAIKLQILEKFRNSLIENLLKGMAAQDKQQQDPKKKFAFNLFQNIEIELNSLNITFLDKYCTQNSFGAKLEHFTCKSSMNPNKPKLRNIEIKNLLLFWQDPITQLNAYATLEDVAEQESDNLSFQLGIIFDQLTFNCSKIQCNAIYKFSEYVSQFTIRQNKQVEKSSNNEDDQKVKGEIKNILKSISLLEQSTECQEYERLCLLVQSQSINDLKQIQFEIMKYDKGEEIVQLRKKKLGWFGGMVKNDKKMGEKIINILDDLDQDPNINLKTLQLKFELVVNQCQIGLSSNYRGQLNKLIINFKNVNLQMNKTNQLQLDFTIKEGEVLLQYQDKINYLVSKNKNFEEKYSLELHHTNDEKKESLFIQTCPFQIVFNEQAFEKYYDLFYFFVVSENQLPKLTKKAKQQIQDIVSDKKEKDIQIKLEKIYILSTNGKETFLFSPGSIDFNYKTQNQSIYNIKIFDTTFGFSEKINSCIDFIHQQYCFNSMIMSRDFIKITNCDIDLVIQVQDNQINTVLELGDMNFQINPTIYKYFYQFYGTHYQKPLKEMKNQLRNNEENQQKFCLFSNTYIKNQIKCRMTFQGHFINLYEAEKDEKIMKIDLQNIQFKQSKDNQHYILELKTNDQIIKLAYSNEEDIQLVVNKCQMSRNDDYYVQNILEQNLNNSITNIQNQIQQQEFLSYIQIKLNSIHVVVLGNQNQPFINIHLTYLNFISLGNQLQSKLTISFKYFTIIKEFNQQMNNFEDKKFLDIQSDENTTLIEYCQTLNENSKLKLYVNYCILNYKAKTIGLILEQYPIELKKDWNLTKFIINSYLTYYPDLQIICNQMSVEINKKQILFKQSELKSIQFQQNYISIMFMQDDQDENCLQVNAIPKGNLIVDNENEMTINIRLDEAQAIFAQQYTLQTSKLKKKNNKKVLLSSCNIDFGWRVVFQTNVIKHFMNFRTNQFKFTFGTKDICYLTKQMQKLSSQITEFYASHDLANYLIQYRVKTYQLTFGVESQMQTVFIDDYFNQSLPIFGLTFNQPIWKLELNLDHIKFHTRNLFEAVNYHSTKLAWEPIFEPISLDFSLYIQNQQPRIILDFNISDIINIDISTEFIQNLLKFKKLVKQFENTDLKQNNEPINQNNNQILTYETYEIQNACGLLIIAYGQDQEPIQLINQQRQITKCKGIFQFEIIGVYSSIKIDNWSLQVQKKKIIIEKGFSLIIETIVDEFMNSSKTIITSSILLINLSPFNLQIKIQNQEIISLTKAEKQQQIQKFQKYTNIYTIPNQIQKGQFCLIENNVISESYNYTDIAQKIKKGNSEIVNLNNKFFRLKSLQDPIMNDRSIISITPVVEFINQTPFIIIIDKHCPQIKQFLHFIINSNQIIEDCEINPQKEYLFSFKIERYYQSIQYSLNELMKGKNVMLEDEKWQLNVDRKYLSLILIIKPKIDNYGRHQITIQFNQSYLINNTDLDLLIYQGTEKNLEILGGQKYNTSFQSIVLQKIQEKQFIVFEERNSNLKSQSLALSEIIKLETIEIKKKVNNTLYFLPIQIEKQFIQYGDYTIPFFQIYYKYILYNRLEQPIYLCYEDKTTLLESLIKQPLQFWKQEHQNNPDFSYECSLKLIFNDQVLQTARFNIMIQQQFVLLIRSINLCIRKFIKITILEKNHEYFLIIDDIQDKQDYPYMIINESKSLQIQLKSDNEKLSSGDSFPLANSFQSDQDFTYPVNLKDQTMNWNNSIQFLLKLDQVGLSGIVEINGQKYDYGVVKVGNQKQFIFKDFQKPRPSQIEQQIQQEKILYHFDLKMQIIGCTISYIENLKTKCKELLICSLDNIIMVYSSNEFNQKQINFKLQKLQIDSQSKKMSLQKTILFSEVSQNLNSIEFELKLDAMTKDSYYSLDLVKINLGNFQFCMDKIFFDKYGELQAQFYDFFNSQHTQKQKGNYLNKLFNKKKVERALFRNQLKQTRIFVRKLILCPMKMKISYLKDNYQLEKQHFVKENFTSSPSNLFHRILRQYIFGDKKFFFNMLSQYLTNRLMINLVKLTNWNQIRIKRAIYEPTRVYKVFNQQQANHQYMLKQVQKCDCNRELSKIKFNIISSHDVLLKGQNKILFICDQQIFFIHQNTIQQFLEYADIQLFYSQADILHLYIIIEKDQLALLFEDQNNLQIAIQNLSRFQN